MILCQEMDYDKFLTRAECQEKDNDIKSTGKYTMSEGAASLIVRFHIMSRIEYNKSSLSFS